jgi:hypothetical protein
MTTMKLERTAENYVGGALLGTIMWFSSRAWTQDRWWDLLSNETFCANMEVLTAMTERERMLTYLAMFGSIITEIPATAVNGFCMLVASVMKAVKQTTKMRSYNLN